MLLLAARQPTGHAPPKDPPLGAALRILRKRQALQIQLPHLLHAPLVGRIANARSQAKAKQIQPPLLEFRRSPTATFTLQAGVGQLANRLRRPVVTPQTEDLLQRFA